MIVNVQNPVNRNHVNIPSFKSGRDFWLNVAKRYLKSQDNVANNRFIQDTATNWIPKAIFTRSIADFADMSFLEFLESGIFYFLPTLFGNIYKKAYLKFHSDSAQRIINSNISKNIDEILNDDKLQKGNYSKKIIATKAAIILGCTAIPAAEYALSFAKNLFTLKFFKKSDFNNIANLNKSQVEDKQQQERVKKNAKKHIKVSALFSLGGFALSLIFAKYGHKSGLIQRISRFIIEPGAYLSRGLNKLRLTKKGGSFDKFLRKYITPDFAGVNEKGRFKLSQGQLLIIAGTGFFGYSAAAKDRGKLDKLEVWTRVPLVVLYTAFGSAFFDKIFNKIFIQKNVFPNVIKKGVDENIVISETKDLPEIAEKISKTNRTSPQYELNKLIKQKAIIKSIPYLFGIVFMGFLLSGITRFWTQQRYNAQQQNKK